MKFALLIAAVLFLITTTSPAQTVKDFAADWDKQHISSLPPSNVRHKDLQKYLEQLKKLGLKVEEVGRSYANREIYQIEWGTGATKVFMWSQMHGDEPTATSALLDMFAYLQNNRGKTWVKELEKTLTIRGVPMLNPDGAERFQRRNAQGIDINRDALNLATPEARLLKQLRDELKPIVGFNLHNQGWRTSVNGRPASISLLSVAYDSARTVNAGRLLTKRLAAIVRGALEPLASGRIGKYDDSFEPRAFGDNITLWGTPVLLIETGPWPAENPDPELVRLNFVALIAALDALASGRVHNGDPARYDSLPMNESELFYYAIRGGQVLRGDGTPAFRADVGITARRRVQGRGAERRVRIGADIEDIGDLRTAGALFDIDATGLLTAPAIDGVKAGDAIRLPDWTASSPSRELVEMGAPGAVMILRPLDEGRYRVERVLSAAWGVK